MKQNKMCSENNENNNIIENEKKRKKKKIYIYIQNYKFA